MTWFSLHCYARNARPTEACEPCGESIEARRSLTYDERLIWTLDHPLPGTVIIAATVLGARRPAAAPPSLCAASWESTRIRTQLPRLCAR